MATDELRAILIAARASFIRPTSLSSTAIELASQSMQTDRLAGLLAPSAREILAPQVLGGARLQANADIATAL